MLENRLNRNSTLGRRILGCLVCFWLAINTMAASWLAGREDVGDLFLPHKRNIAQLQKPVDALFFGNSMSSSAIQPALLAVHLPGFESYNHSLLVGGVAIPHMALNAWLESFRAPHTIVWTLSHFEMSGKPSIVTMKFEQKASLSDLSWIPDAGAARMVLAQYVWCNLLSPVSRDAQFWTDWIKGSAAPAPPLTSRGSQILDTSEADKDPLKGFESTRNFYRSLMTNDFVRDGKTAGVIVSFKKRCDTMGIRLVIISPPVSSRHAELFHSVEDHDWAFTTLNAACQAHGIELWDLRREFTDADFADGVHLQKRVIPEYNRRLAGRIKKLAP